MKKIAVIGTGIMGAGIASNYLKNGYEVYVWNRGKEKLQDLVSKGAIQASTPKEAAEKADVIFEVTANDESSKSVWLGEDGILMGAKKDSYLISSGTLSVLWVDELAKICGEKDLNYLDMPLTGGRSGAETGQLILLAGATEEKLQGLKPDLNAISKEILYFGKTGAGARFKLLLNALQGMHLAALSEVLKIAEKSGMDVKAAGDALSERPGGTTTKLGWRDYQKTPDPINFSVEWIVKDLLYAKSLASGLKTPFLDDSLKKYSEAKEKGQSESDWTVITHS